jgi:ferric-dicitrate binding protein FerR (iron transport regulator)
MRPSVLAVSIVLFSVLANGCSKDISRATAATVLSVKGRVVFGKADRNAFEPVTLKSRIHDGDTVRSADGASLDLTLVPGALVRLSGDSEIKIEHLSLTKDGNETGPDMRDRSARMLLSRGKIFVLFSPSETSASQVVIKAGQLTISPDSDCLFCVGTDGTTTRVTCSRGNINASVEAHSPVTIAAGYFQQWPTARTQPGPATDDATAQIDITSSLQAGGQLQEQASAWQNRRPF